MGNCTQCQQNQPNGPGGTFDRNNTMPANQIPPCATPRGELGNVSDVKCMLCLPSRPPLRIWETFGDSTRLLNWNGPGQHTGLDLRTCSFNGDFDRLLLRQLLVGASSAYLPETHRGALIRIDSTPAANRSLEMLGQSLANAYEHGVGLYNIDEYCAVFDALPDRFATKDQMLAQFLRAPIKMMLDDSGNLRNSLNRGAYAESDGTSAFRWMRAGAHQEANDPTTMPTIGDWYRIRLPGNNGDFMIVHAEMKPRRSVATIQSMTDQEAWFLEDAPVVGRRQIGIESLASGGWRFFVRGFDRPTARQDPDEATSMRQHVMWTDVMRALAAGQGGRAETTGIWGWVRQVPGEALASSLLGGCPELGPT